MSSTRLLVLGAVRIFQPVHGYLVRRELLSWRVEEWANVKPGSIYNALRTLTKEGYLAEAGSEANGARPEKTLYRLTMDGDNEYFALLRRALWTVDHTDQAALRAGLSFMSTLPRDEVIAALGARTTHLESAAVAVEHAIRHLEQTRSAPSHVVEHLRLNIALSRAERDFTRDLCGRLEAGYYRFVPEEGWDAGPGPDGFPPALPHPVLEEP